MKGIVSASLMENSLAILIYHHNNHHQKKTLGPGIKQMLGVNQWMAE